MKKGISSFTGGIIIGIAISIAVVLIYMIIPTENRIKETITTPSEISIEHNLLDGVTDICTEVNSKIIEITPEVNSKIIEITPDLSNVPSYAKPESYTIIKINNVYFARLPGGTILDGPFNSPKKAQVVINKAAKWSYERWINSGGIDF